jgi:hypothetical protein
MRVFIGPTGHGMNLDGLDVFAPAQQGDIARAVHEGEKTIVLIDGFFTQNLAPWHKEILHAIHQGCRVIGAGSLGALRAVECERYGAEPVGVIAKWYKNGTCTDDADVALAHSAAEDGCKQLSVPLVNIMATAKHLEESGKIKSAQQVIEQCRGIFYMERSWQRLLKDLGDTGQLIKDNYIDQKRLDAEEAIAHARKPVAVIPSAKHIYTSNMGMLLEHDMPNSKGRPWELSTHKEEAIALHMLVEMAATMGVNPNAYEVSEQSKAMWQKLGITSDKAASEWMEANNVSQERWNMFAIKLAVKQCVLDWFDSTDGCILAARLEQDYKLFNNL